MKKIIITLLVLVIALGLCATALAVEVTTCTVSAENVTAVAGGQITVPVSISSNLGFTNFGIALDYDRESLELVSISPSKLCGDLVSVNTAWDSANDENAKNNTAFSKGSTYGYVVCASEKAITGEGELFTATFNVSSDFSGTAAVTPIISYMRNNSAVLTVFEEISVTAEKAVVSANGVLLGDADGNGSVTVKDALLIYKVYRGFEKLTEERMIAADVDCNGSVTVKDALAAYKIYRGV